MAGSSFSRKVNSHWQVRGVWSSTPNTAGNYSDVTLRVYWESTDSYGTTYTSDSKSGSSTVNGARDTFSFSAKLSGKDSRLVKTHTERVNHNADGRKTINLSATLAIELDLGGWVGSVSISDDVTLDTIPRKSLLSTVASWTAGGNKAITVKEQYSGFTHKVYIDAQNPYGTWVNVKEIDFGGASVNTNFTDAEHKKLFEILAGRASCPARFNLHTYSGGAHIGTDEGRTGTVTAPSASSVKISNPTNVSATSGQGAYTVWIDQTINIAISRSNGDFTHTVRFQDYEGKTYKTITGVGTSASWTPTSAEQNTLYAMITQGIEFDGNIEVETFYQGVKVRSSVNGDINYRVRNANPVFTASQVTYKDTNPATVALTGSDQLIVQGKSVFKAYVNSGATAQKGASIKSYVLTINGQTLSKNGTGEFAFPKPITAGANQILTIKVTDSRGLSVTVTKNVTIVPYSEPTLNATAKRQNSFGENVTLRTNGTISSLNNKNVVSSLQYRYKEQGSTTWLRDWTAISTTVSGTNFTGANIPIVMDVVKLYDVEIRISDKLTTNKTVKATVGAGQPIFFIDSKLRSLGMNDFPKYSNEFRVNGRIVFGANMWANNAGGEGDLQGALDMNNSDIVGANGIFFNDASDSKGEGLHFIKSGKPAKSTNNADYDTFSIRDNVFLMNTRPFMSVNGELGEGIAVTLGGNGLTIVGAGESPGVVYDHRTSDATEEMYVTSDSDVYIMSGMQAGWNSRRIFKFSGTGDFISPGLVQAGPNLRMNGANSIENMNDIMWLGGKTGLTLNSHDGDVRFDLRHDGKGMILSQTITNRTTSAGANLHINGSSVIHKVTSSLKYKTNIQPLGEDFDADRILQLEPKSWIDKNQSYEKMLNDMGLGHFYGLPEVLPRHFGLIAEEVAELGLTGYVQYDDEGNIDGIQYDRLWTLLIPVVKKLKREVEELKGRIGAVSNGGSSTMK